MASAASPTGSFVGTLRGQLYRSVIATLLAGLIFVPSARVAPSQDADCSAYDSQIWAQSVFETDSAAYAALDPDGNGLACEQCVAGAAPALWTHQIPADAVPAQVISVTDGDTIRVSLEGRNEPVRLILIDSPETHDLNDLPECFGQEATAFAQWLFSLGGQLYLEGDVSNRDRYDRLLRYVWLDFGDGEVYLVNEAMVRSGYAALFTYPPDLRYVEEMREAQRFAREHGYGLWSGCLTDAEGDTNELTPQNAAPPAPSESGNSPQPDIVTDPPQAFDCNPSYPEVCIPPPPPDLDCADIGPRRFTVLPPDPHNFDGDFNGVGCERE
jgi:micrococcal nuclease